MGLGNETSVGEIPSWPANLYVGRGSLHNFLGKSPNLGKGAFMGKIPDWPSSS